VVAEITDNLLLRLSGSKVMSRPELGNLAPTSGVTATTRTGNVNNPFLDPIRAKTADLALVDRKAWTATALAWLQPYLEAPLPSTEDTVAAVETSFRGTTEDAQALQLLATLQKQAATDLVVLPLTQSDEYLYVRTGAEMTPTSYGPGWQLGLFGISRG